MSNTLKISTHNIGNGFPAYVIGEIGINHNGNLNTALKLIDAADFAGCDAVKFQKRVPELCVPEHQKNKERETPWGIMSYLDYKRRIEFEQDEYEEINDYCRKKEIDWFASCWDSQSIDFIEQFSPPCYKVASACLTSDVLLEKLCDMGRPVILSTGMSTIAEINKAVSLLDISNLAIMHSTSAYPCSPDELNLKMINTLRSMFNCPIGYSGHEVGLQTTCAAVAMGANLVERHITLDRAMWGSDQAASVEPWGLMRLVRDIRVIEQAMGDGIKRVYDSEIPMISKLRTQ